MVVTIERRYSDAIHPFHAILLAGIIPWFLGAVLSDISYMATYEIQWANFASWFIVGGLVFTGVTIAFTIIDLCRAHRRAQGIALYAVFLLATWMAGFFNALMHARDAWASMPGGLILSVITIILACLATWLGFQTPRILRKAR